MTMLPGWNSLNAVGSMSQSLHIAAMVVLALLIAAEGMALAYDNRKYAPIGVAERELSATRDREQEEVEEHHQSKLAALQHQLERAQAASQQRRDAAKPAEAPRRLTVADQQRLVAALSLFPGQQMEITPLPGDPEQSSLPATSFRPQDRLGGTPQMAPVKPLSRPAAPVLTAFLEALVNLRILPAASVTICEGVAKDVIGLVVGTRSSLAVRELPSTPIEGANDAVTSISSTEVLPHSNLLARQSARIASPCSTALTSSLTAMRR